jgi:hypothetical protein
LVGSSSTRKFGGFEQHQREHEPGLLAAAQDRDALLVVVARELERAEQRALLARCLERELLVHLPIDSEVRVEQVERLPARSSRA